MHSAVICGMADFIDVYYCYINNPVQKLNGGAFSVALPEERRWRRFYFAVRPATLI
jgi:hypothetical protein